MVQLDSRTRPLTRSLLLVTAVCRREPELLVVQHQHAPAASRAQERPRHALSACRQNSGLQRTSIIRTHDSRRHAAAHSKDALFFNTPCFRRAIPEAAKLPRIGVYLATIASERLLPALHLGRRLKPGY